MNDIAPACACGKPVAPGASTCELCGAFEAAATLGVTAQNVPKPHVSPAAWGNNKLQLQANRLAAFFNDEDGEWPPEKCAEYLQSLNQQERRELWEDIDFQLREEREGRSGGATLAEAQRVSRQNIDLVPVDTDEPHQPCCHCGTKFSQSYRDAADPVFVVWICDRCFSKRKGRVHQQQREQGLRRKNRRR